MRTPKRGKKYEWNEVAVIEYFFFEYLFFLFFMPGTNWTFFSKNILQKKKENNLLGLHNEEINVYHRKKTRNSEDFLISLNQVSTALVPECSPPQLPLRRNFTRTRNQQVVHVQSNGPAHGKKGHGFEVIQSQVRSAMVQ